MKYDYLIVGSGLFGAVLSNLLTKHGKSCLVLERRNHIGGNCYTETIEGIEVHTYGAHIFRTSNRKVWQYVNEFDEFNNFINTPVAKYKNELYNLPFNMNTFHQMWGVHTPEEAKSIIESQRDEIIGSPSNLEEKAISLVGRDIYTKLIKGYTEKQWGRSCKELPESIIRRIPVRFTFNNNYFNDEYQGIPKRGYTNLLKSMLAGSEVLTNVDFNKDRQKWLDSAKTIIYTGPIDELFDYCEGPLEYRSLRFDTVVMDKENLQGVAVMNFTEREVPYTRRIEHKHFKFGSQEKTVISYEYPLEWKPGIEPYYPINDEKNSLIYQKYSERAKLLDNFYLGGRLGEYRYYDMQDTVASAMKLAERLLSN